MEKLSIWEHLNGSTGIGTMLTLWSLLGFSVLVVTVALERTIIQWGFMTRARALADTVSRCLTRGAIEEGRSACERSRSPLADVFLVGYERLGRVKAANVDSAVHRERVRILASLKGPLWMLGTVGATAPFVGLFGTVLGILFGFGDLEEADARGEAGIGVVSGHISEALYATAFGILVAVVAVVVFNFYNQRLSRVALEIKMLTDEFLEQLHEFGGPDKDENQAGHSKSKDKGKSKSKGKAEEDADGDRKAA